MLRPTVHRVSAWLLTATVLCVPASVGPFVAQAEAQGSQAQGSQPPHAWLFGTWSGGLFPAPSGLTAESCLSQPVVIFTRDLVLRATLTDQFYTQRLVSTARVTTTGVEFAFRPSETNELSNGLFGVAGPPPAAGFGCESADVLHVKRLSENEISFPGCSDFPNPLIRCPSK
jgi:hypothetical protein